METIFDIFFDEVNNVFQVRTKSKAFVIEFPDLEEKAIFQAIIDKYRTKSFYTFAELKGKLKHFNDCKITDVIQELIACGILNSENFENGNTSENSMPFQVWNGITLRPDGIRITYIGQKNLGEKIRLYASLKGYNNIECIFVPEEKIKESRLQKIVEKSDFVIMDANNWNPLLLSNFNELMLKENKPWLFISGLVDTINYSIGPIFHGKETGCYSCLESRIFSNDNNAQYTKEYKQFLLDNNKFSKHTSVDELIENIIANIVVVDVIKYISGSGVPEMWKNNLLFNIHNYTLHKHYLLKNPLCQTCNPELQYSISPWIDGIIPK